MLSIVFANIGAIVINDIADIGVDRISDEEKKRMRPLVTGAITVQEGYIIAILFYALSVFVAFLYGPSAVIFSVVIIIFSVSYSLPPFRFCAKPASSMVYWIVLCIVCYGLMVLCLENIQSSNQLLYTGRLWAVPEGWLFIAAVILFMAIAEVISKDIRDIRNDVAGGRNTFVNFIGTRSAVTVMRVFAWAGFLLWLDVLYSLHLHYSVFSWAVAVVGVWWCIRIHQLSGVLLKEFKQATAAKLHTEWTTVYAVMQALTVVSFIS